MRRSLLALALGAPLVACASRPPPVTKLVGGKVVVTRSVNHSAYEHAARALVLEEEERWAEAAAELQRALISDREAPELHARLAEVFMRLDRLEDAEEAIAASFAIAPTVPGLVAQAHLAERRGDAAGAVNALRRAVALVDFGEDAATAEATHLELAQAELVALDSEGARRTLRRVCDLAPTSTEARIMLAAVAWALGDLGEAERRLQEALREEPNELQALITLAWLYAAEGRAPQARTAFKEALERSEGSPDIAAAYARFLVGAGDRRAAEQLADDLASPELVDADAAVAEIEIERSAQRLDRAVALARRTRDGEATPEVKARVTVALADLLHEQGKKDEAIATLLGMPRGAPGHADARLRAAELLRDAGRVADARKALDGIDASDESVAVEVEVARALVDEKSGDAARAVKRLEAVLAREPDDDRVTLTMAAIEERRGQWRRALALVEPVLRREPANVAALNFWGYVAVDQRHDLPLATKRLRAALSLEPGSAAIIDSVGWAHFRARDLPKATLFLEQAARLEPDDPEILAHVGELALARGDRDRAARAFRQALSHEPDDRLKRRLEDELARLGAKRAAGR